MRVFLFTVFVMLLLYGCNNCPPNIYLGRVSLSENARSENVYTEAQLAFFKNAEGRLLPLRISGFSRIALSEGVILGELCSGNGGDAYVKGDLEYIFGELIWPDSTLYLDRAVDLGIVFGLESLSTSADTSLVEVANIYYRQRNPQPAGPPSDAYLRRVIFDRGHTDDRIANLNEYAFIKDTVMLEQQLTNLYRPADNGSVYYSPEKGIVAFRDNTGDLWVLDGME